MALVLECAHPLQRDPVADVDVRCGDVDPELHAQRPAERELALEPALGEDVDGVAGQIGDGHGPAIIEAGPPNTGLESAPPVLRRRPSTAAPPKPRRRIRKLRLLVLLGVLALLCSTAFTFGFVTALAGEIPKLDPRYQVEAERDGYIYANDGKTILAVLRGDESRVLLEPDEISPLMKHAIVAIEDRRFNEHDGVDLRGILRAGWEDITNKSVVQGGSTITQQFVKNAIVKDDRTISRKVKEAALAWQLEQRWDKDQILTAYLNTIYFGNGAYGVQQAALTYFGHGAAELTLPEAALLAAVPKDPSQFDPVANPRDARARRNLILRLLFEQGKISRARLDRRVGRTAAQGGGDAAAVGEHAGRPVLRELREAAADRRVRRGQGVRRRLPRHDVDRPRAAEGGEARDREVASRPRRAGCRARRDRSTRRQRRCDGRGKELPREPVQPRRAGAAPAGLGLQAVRPRGRAAAGDRAGLDVRLEADLDLARRPDLARVQLRPRLPRCDQPRRRNHAL